MSSPPEGAGCAQDAGPDVQRYATAVIYCRAVSVAFGAAPLTPS
ncbi:MAG: DM13 domain-containing protein [Chloroflexi bacterium]|nr:MAG: DM13 domain-containing protein [Chloroflexota bacterium]